MSSKQRFINRMVDEIINDYGNTDTINIQRFVNNRAVQQAETTGYSNNPEVTSAVQLNLLIELKKRGLFVRIRDGVVYKERKNDYYTEEEFENEVIVETHGSFTSTVRLPETVYKVTTPTFRVIREMSDVSNWQDILLEITELLNEMDVPTPNGREVISKCLHLRFTELMDNQPKLQGVVVVKVAFDIKAGLYIDLTQNNKTLIDFIFS